MNLIVPNLALVVLVGPSGCGKSTIARKLFKPTEILSSDFCRGLVSDDENRQDATRDAFELLHFIASKRLTRGLLTVVDATNVQEESRRHLLELAAEHDVIAAAIVLNLPEQLCHERNKLRADRNFGPHVIRQQHRQMRQSLRRLEREGFRYVHVLSTIEEVEAAQIERQPLWNDRNSDYGPFDIIGDIHGCFDELAELLGQLGYVIESKADGATVVTPPVGRKAIFLGDLVDRGPKSPQVLKLVMNMIAAGTALCIPGNHDVKLMRKLRGKDVQIAHGLAQTLAQLENEPREFLDQVSKFIDGLVGHYVLDGGGLVVAHAGMKERYIGRASRRVREFALYGETTGETDELGLPQRINWAADYRGSAAVVYGHTPVHEADWLNGPINIDTGCVFGGKLTALRWPERIIVSVPAHDTYAESQRKFLPENIIGTNGHSSAPSRSLQQQHDESLDVEDVLGKRIITTRLFQNITVREENAAAALEVMSRFAADPRWLIYLPPTMCPTQTSNLPDVLEHPHEGFAYYRNNGIAKVVCEEKHMGSRAVLILCRDEMAAMQRFGISDDGIGIIYTRTGRRFFENREIESQLLQFVHDAMTRAGWWDQFASSWFCLDCELMPWSAKAQQLLKDQYASTGAAASAALADVVAALQQSQSRESNGANGAMQSLLARQIDRKERIGKYIAAYRRYCWPVMSVADLKLAPFHLLASEGKVHVDRDHLWHMQTLAQLAEQPGPIVATPHRLVDVTDPESIAGGTEWWEQLTGAGGEGMVIKPLGFAERGSRGLIQPAVKCRGREYLRIIYGAEYDLPENIERLRKRGIAAKAALALREFALGIESLERFVRREPLRRVHECVFAVLAMESEPVDPAL